MATPTSVWTEPPLPRRDRYIVHALVLGSAQYLQVLTTVHPAPIYGSHAYMYLVLLTMLSGITDQALYIAVSLRHEL